MQLGKDLVMELLQSCLQTREDLCETCVVVPASLTLALLVSSEGMVLWRATTGGDLQPL